MSAGGAYATQRCIKEATSNRIEVAYITVETMKAMLEFIYTDRVEFMYTGRVEKMDQDRVVQLLVVAEKYNMQAMKVSEFHRRLD